MDDQEASGFDVTMRMGDALGHGGRGTMYSSVHERANRQNY